MAFAFTKNPRIFCKCKCHCWVWRMVDSLYYSSRKIPKRCENSFVNYRIYYQKLCDLMRQITKEMNWPIVSKMLKCKKKVVFFVVLFCFVFYFIASALYTWTLIPQALAHLLHHRGFFCFQNVVNENPWHRHLNRKLYTLSVCQLQEELTIPHLRQVAAFL